MRIQCRMPRKKCVAAVSCQMALPSSKQTLTKDLGLKEEENDAGNMESEDDTEPEEEVAGRDPHGK